MTTCHGQGQVKFAIISTTTTLPPPPASPIKKRSKTKNNYPTFREYKSKDGLRFGPTQSYQTKSYSSYGFYGFLMRIKMLNCHSEIQIDHFKLWLISIFVAFPWKSFTVIARLPLVMLMIEIILYTNWVDDERCSNFDWNSHSCDLAEIQGHCCIQPLERISNCFIRIFCNDKILLGLFVLCWPRFGIIPKAYDAI